jgi:two-component system chemotaxis response regulator CheB
MDVPSSRMPDRKTPWIVAIGASGGRGLRDIQELLAAFPKTMPAIIMVVLHRGWGKPTHLQSVLARASSLPVVIAAQSEQLELGRIYIGEPSEHLTLAAHRFGGLVDDPDRLYGNRTIDLLFTSVAQHAGTRMIGVVLSGSLDDGSRGLAAIHHAGGLTMVLTPADLLARGMPENAIEYDGQVSLIGDPRRIADGICTACAS